MTFSAWGVRRYFEPISGLLSRPTPDSRALAAETQVGASTAQSAPALSVDQIPAEYDGSGVTVGVLSDSFGTSLWPSTSAQDDVLSGDLPGEGNPNGYTTPVQILDDSSIDSARQDEGRAMAQIIHDIAPGAKILFHTASKGAQEYADAIDELVAEGADVIVDDVIYFDQPFFQDGVIAQAVDRAAAAGVLYFSAAGNYGQDGFDGTLNLVSDAELGALAHNFGPPEAERTRLSYNIPPGGEFAISLQWDDPFVSAVPGDAPADAPGRAGADGDLGLAIYTAGTNTLLFRQDDENIGGDPIEMFKLENASTEPLLIDMAIYLSEGEAPEQIKFIEYGSAVQIGGKFTTSTIVGQAAAEGASAVGAGYYTGAPAFGGSEFRLANYSSTGDHQVLFTPEGERLETPLLRQGVEYVAVDGVNNTFFGPTDPDRDGAPNFFGTSAAAPAAAGAAALLIDAVPHASAAQILEAMSAGALDVLAPGVDAQSGNGLVQTDAALEALNLLAPPQTITPPAPLPLPSLPEVIAQVGSATATHESVRIEFAHDFEDPIIIAQVLTHNGRQTAEVRIDEINEDNFVFHIDEPEARDGVHLPEEVAFLIIEKGEWTLSNGLSIEAGEFTTEGTRRTDGYEEVGYASEFEDAPIVLTQIQTNQDPTFARARVAEVGQEGFRAAVEQEQARNALGRGAEDVGYLAIEEGAGDWVSSSSEDTFLFEAQRTPKPSNSNFKGFDFLSEFDAAPLVFAGSESVNGSDPAGVRLRNLDADGVAIRMEEDTSADRERFHVKEDTAYLAIGGDGLLWGVAQDASDFPMM